MAKTYRGYTQEQIAGVIDHSILKPDHKYGDVDQGARVALQFQTASLCIRPIDVVRASKLLAGSGVAVCTVIGFPHGSSTTSVKVFETLDAIQNGAQEVDMVMNVSAMLSGDYSLVESDIRSVAEAAHSKSVSLKVIFETAYLDLAQIVQSCQIAENAGADYVKTSTGFASAGATLEHIKLMKKTVGDRLKVKSSGGVRSLDQLIDFIDAGVSRSGSSATEAIMDEFEAKAN